MSGLVGEPTLGELLGADAVIFSTLANDGTLSSWAVDTAKRTTLAKSEPERVKVPKVVYPPMPQRESGTAAWIEEIKEIARANPTVPFAPKPAFQIGGLMMDEFIRLSSAWERAKKEVRPIKGLTLFQITGGTNNEAETIQSFLANNSWVQNNYTLYDRSVDTDYGQYAGSFTGLTSQQRRDIQAMTDASFTGTVQQVGRKNMLVLNAYTPKISTLNMQSLEYADALELWVKLQWAVGKIIKTDLDVKPFSTTSVKSEVERRVLRQGYINSQFGTGINRAEAETLTQLLITDTLSIPLKSIALSEFSDVTRDIKAANLAYGSLFNFNWSRSGNRNRLDVTRDNRRYAMEYGSRQEFMRKMRGLTAFVLSCLGAPLQGLEGYDLSTAPDPARVPANFTKLTRVITQGGVPSGGFYIGNATVTQREYEAVMKKNPSFTKNPAQPVNNVSIIDAMIFCNQMSIRDGLEPAYFIESSVFVTLDNFASGYRLATSDEWNYARDKIEGMGVFAEYVYDGAFVTLSNDVTDRYGVPNYARMLANGLADGFSNRIQSDQGSKEVDVRAPYEPKSYEQDIGEGKGPIANTRRSSTAPVIRLVRPIFDYWKYTSGQ
jgi:hypothetical protein